jgi:hypothetical protein
MNVKDYISSVSKMIRDGCVDAHQYMEDNFHKRGIPADGLTQSVDFAIKLNAEGEIAKTPDEAVVEVKITASI